MDKNISVYIIDDHPVIIDCIKLVLKKVDDIEVIGSSTEGIKALQELKELSPNVVIVDLHMPDIDGFEIMRSLREICEDMKFIVFTGDVDEKVIIQSVLSGANGFVLKGLEMENLVNAVRVTSKGDYYFCKKAGEDIVNKLSGSFKGNVKEMTEKLSPRELELMTEISKGVSCSEIARHLKIDLNSVYTYRNRLMNKVGAKNPTELVKIALQVK